MIWTWQAPFGQVLNADLDIHWSSTKVGRFRAFCDEQHIAVVCVQPALSLVPQPAPA
jgi:hypothetical protein